MPEGYPTVEAPAGRGWLPVPRQHACRFAASWRPAATTPLADFGRVADLAGDWGSRLVDLGEVGHLNPASGYGAWPR